MSLISVPDLHKACSGNDGAWPHRTWALFDVREMGESQKGHIPGATFLPRRMIELRLRELLSAPKTRIVVYDDGGEDGRALHAAKTLSGFGYENVSVLDGGLQFWQAAGYEVATGWNVPCKDFGERLLVSSQVPYINSDDLAGRIEAGENIGVFDVRTPQEYTEGSLPVSTSAPSFDWTLHVDDWARDYDGVVIHCAGRTRSIFGTETGRLLGMKNLWALENGTMGWRLSDRDLASCQDRMLPLPSVDSIANVRERALDLARAEGAGIISPSALSQRLESRLEKPIYIFDTRDVAAFKTGHIGSSILLPGGQACQRADDFAAVPDADIVFVDDNDSRAGTTAYWYRRMGFRNVFVLDGGVAAWRSAGLPIETGRGRKPPLGLVEAQAAAPACSLESLSAALERKQPPVVIDVGKSGDYKACHVKGAQLIPRGYLEDRIADAASPAQPIVITARDPAQAAFAAAALVGMGYADVCWLNAPGKTWPDGISTESGSSGTDALVEDTLAIPYKKTKKEMVEYLEWEEKLGEKYKNTGSDERV
tara:strand:+ start:16412 stop:18025 length:1614 start_codon:yes stop_codon:yes gene_type:complete